MNQNTFALPIPTEMKKSLRFNSKTIHGGQQPDKAYGAVMPPIYQTSTFAQDSPGSHKGFENSRSGNPTRQALEASFASIENGSFGLAFASGLAAMDAVMKLLSPGDEVVSTNDLYGGSYRLFRRVFEPFGIKFRFVDMRDTSRIEEAITAKRIAIRLNKFVKDERFKKARMKIGEVILDLCS